MVVISETRGYDPHSYGLIFRGNKAPDNYIPTRLENGLVVYVQNPLTFLRDTVSENPLYKKIPDFRVFVRRISVRGVITNDKSGTVDKRLIPIRATANIKGENPYEYAKQLKAIKHSMTEEPPNLEPYRLDYIPDINAYSEIIISQLPDIDLTSSGNVTISAGKSTSISVPLPFILDKKRSEKDYDKITIEKVSNYANGFRFRLKLAGQKILNDYTEQPRQMAVLDDQQTFMITDYSQDKQLKETAAFQVIPEMIDDLLTGNGGDIYASTGQGLMTLANSVMTTILSKLGVSAVETLSSSVVNFLDYGTDFLWLMEADKLKDLEKPSRDVIMDKLNLGVNLPTVVKDIQSMDPSFQPPEPTPQQLKDGSYADVLRDYIESRKLPDTIIEDIMRLMVVISAIQNPSGILDMYQQHYLYDARADDRTRQADNVGGNVVENMLNKEYDQLVQITYPVADRVQTKSGLVFPRDFAENEEHEYAINKVFNNMKDFTNYIETNYPGELLSFDGEPVITYGDYTLEFQKLIAKGLMLL